MSTETTDSSSEVQPEQYDHRIAWGLGCAVFGTAVAAVGLAGSIVLRVKPWDPRSAGATEQVVSMSNDLDGTQWIGIAVLVVSAILLTVGKAAQQVRGRLPIPILLLIDAVASMINWSVGKLERAVRRRRDDQSAATPGPVEPPANEPLSEDSSPGRAIANVQISGVAMIFGALFAGFGAALAAETGFSGVLAGTGLAGATISLTGLLAVSRRVTYHVLALFVSLVLTAVGANVGAGSRAAIITLGFFWTLAVWKLIVGARHLRLWAIMSAVAVAAIALALINELDNTLRSLASPGSLPRGFGDLAPLTEPFGAADRVHSVGTTWRTFLEQTDRGDIAPHDHALRLGYVIVDSSLLAPAVALLMFVFARSIAGRLGAAKERSRNTKSILTVTQFAMPIYLGLDIAENFTGAAAVQAVTGTAQSQQGLADLAELLAVIHWMTSVLKWTTLAGAAIAILAGVVWVVSAPRPDEDIATSGALTGPGPRRLPEPIRPAVDVGVGDARDGEIGLLARWDAPYTSLIRDSTRWQTKSARPVISALVLLRASVAIVIVVILALRNPQAYDSIRALVSHSADKGSSGIDDIQAFLLVVLALGAGVVIRVLGELLVRQIRGGIPTGAAGRIGHALIVLALALVFWLFLDSPGLLVALGIYLSLELLSLPLKGGEVTDADDEHLRPYVESRAARLRAEFDEFKAPHWLSILAAGALVVVTVVGSVLGGSAAVRWILVVFGALVALHAVLDITLRQLAPEWRYTTRLLGDEVGEEAVEFDPEIRAAVSNIAYVLGALIPIAIGATIARSALGLIIYGGALTDDTNGDWFLFLIGIGIPFVGVVVQRMLRTNWLPEWTPSKSIAAVRLVLASVVAVYVLVWETITVGSVISITRHVGALGVLLLFAILLAVVTTAITYVCAETSPVRSLRLFGIQRPPLFTLVFAWLLIASVIDGGGYHDAPVREGQTQYAYQPVDSNEAPVNRDRGLAVTPEQALDRWIAECAGSSDEVEAVPLIFVAASGGGIRAAYWTATNLERLDRSFGERYGDRCNPIFAASGASGGSLGLGVYVVDDLSSGAETAQGRLTADYLSPTIAWFLFADLVRPFVLWDGDGAQTVDRGEMLERAWATPLDPTESDRTIGNAGRCTADDSDAPADADGGGGAGADDTEPSTMVSLESGLRETWCLGAPLLILNGTEVGSGCRFIASVLDNGDPAAAADPTAGTCLRPQTDGPPDSGPLGATIDLVDALCPGEDITLATGALLSARFPFVSPSGRVPIRSCADGGADAAGEPAFVVDGGYIDNSGASSVVQLWSDISTTIDEHNAPYVADEVSADARPCIVPFFLQLDNGYDFTAATVSSRPLEFIVPLQAAMASRGSREAEAKQIAAEIFSPPTFSGALTARSGSRDVNRWFRVVPEAHPGIQAPLGWVLSDAAEADLDREADRQQQSGELADLIDVLSTDLTCSAPEIE